MLSIIDVNTDVLDRIAENENAHLSFAKFNRFSKLAELALIDWLTGDTAGLTPPEPWLTQKNKDWLSPFIVKKLDHVVDSVIQKPSDYYKYDNFYLLGGGASVDCEDTEVTTTGCNRQIEVLDGQQFYVRCNTYIKDEKPSLKKPIAKFIGKTIEVQPIDIGSVGLEYIRYPKFGSIVTMQDNEYNVEVADPAKSTDYEWDERSRGLLEWFIVNLYADHTRERALKEFNAATGKTVRDEK